MSTFLRLPFFSALEPAQCILVAGCGGGYDVFNGLPLYFGLRAAGKTVYLANLSFSYLNVLPAKRLSPAVVEVTADAPLGRNYFPELLLSRWFRGQGEETSIFCFERTGVVPLTAAYRAVVDHLKLDTVILVDGGTDSLMRGDEVDLGTPQEDIASILAVNEIKSTSNILVCLGFGVDFFHGVCHSYFLEAVAELTRSGAYLGMFSLLAEMPEVQRYRAAVEAVHTNMARQKSIVSSSILSALEGHFGNHQANERTAGSELWINPLMPVYWGFRLPAVAQRVLYGEEMLVTQTYREVNDVINEFRNHCPDIRPWKSIPV
jgi:hypothetical protein